MIVKTDHTRLSNLQRNLQHTVKMKIMIINDSKAMRLFLEETIKSYSDCQIIGSYFDANHALHDLDLKKPDVLLLDLEMPNMDGITFLERLDNPEKYPTIIISNYASDGSKLVNDAMALGAVDSLMPPSSNRGADIKKFKFKLRHKIIKASLKSNRYFLFSSKGQPRKSMSVENF